jgi:gliding motility-associated-like protein
MYPVPAANFTYTAICLGNPSCFTDLSTISSGNLVAWSWDFDDPIGGNTSNLQNPCHTYSSAALVGYDVFLSVTSDSGCTNIMHNPVHVYGPPAISITTNGSAVLHAGSSVQLIANGANNYVWNTGASTNNITVDSAGTYFVTGTDMNNCKAKDSIMVMAENSDTISVTGNLLTPNGDGINDELKIFNISAYASCELNIYNMWNDKVYSVMEYKNDWKGTNSMGANLPAGPYYYIIKCDDKPLLKGNINILR